MNSFKCYKQTKWIDFTSEAKHNGLIQVPWDIKSPS